MEKIKLNENFFNNKPKYKGHESTLYLYEGSLIKIFNQKDYELIKNKIAKLEIISDIKEDIIKPTHLVYMNNNVIGYAMDYKKGYKNTKKTSHMSKKTKLKVLNNTLDQLNILHKYGIIYGDLHRSNILYNKKGKSYLCDLDNTRIGNLDFDILYIVPKVYVWKISEIDEVMDNYMFNIITSSILYNHHELKALEYMRHNKESFKNLNDDYLNIINAMTSLNNKTKNKIKKFIK